MPADTTPTTSPAAGLLTPELLQTVAEAVATAVAGKASQAGTSESIPESTPSSPPQPAQLGEAIGQLAAPLVTPVVANEIEFNAEEKTGCTEDYGLDDTIPIKDINNAPPGIDPEAASTEYIMNLVALDREVRVAGLVFNANTYPTTNKVTLSGTSQFSDDSSDPIGVISDALDSCIVRPNVMVIGRPAFSKLARHPKIVSACLRNSGESGIARRQDIAALFELEEVLVGESFVNNARKGQPASMARTWGKHLSLIYRNKQAAPQRDVTFGMTVPFGRPIAGSMFDSKIGLRGGKRVRAGESVRELITCSDLGYFIQDAVN